MLYWQVLMADVTIHFMPSMRMMGQNTNIVELYNRHAFNDSLIKLSKTCIVPLHALLANSASLLTSRPFLMMIDTSDTTATTDAFATLSEK